MRAPGLAALLSLLLPTAPIAAREALPDGMVYLRDVDGSIVQDMRYAGPDNFVGRPLPGYGAGECVLRREVAQALARVQAELARQQLNLKVYDCYRPRRAVAAMARWANDGAAADAGKRFYPALEKRTLFASGYIAAQSAHSTGTAIDLTLVKLPAAPAAAFDPAARYGACTGPAAQRAPDSSLDMGTGFDCFDARSHTASNAISSEQKRARATLLAAMRQHGFKNYFREWWHFTYSVPDARSYDVPIGPRR
ncbi:MAG: M15 family metallopeptidase [Rhizobiales bacterium]|nr:M15 family metallopeptidase [Hyphomicrobiales bacterium]